MRTTWLVQTGQRYVEELNVRRDPLERMMQITIATDSNRTACRG
jgi:hypothetical protein